MNDDNGKIGYTTIMHTTYLHRFLWASTGDFEGNELAEDVSVGCVQYWIGGGQLFLIR